MKFMKRALELAGSDRTRCRPNPMVGAVIVENGRIIAEGRHEYFGGAHAERAALSSLPESKNLSACTLYVTLEPCSHQGKTPPCCDLIIQRGVGSVVVGARDANPLVAGQGLARLKAAGIRVQEGVLEQECTALNEIFFKYITRNMPFVIVKSALTLDGKIAADSGHSRWVSGEKSRAHAQHLRANVMAIMAGIGTILADNPRLTCRLPGMPSPLRVAVDSSLRIPIDAALLKDQDKTPTIVACSEHAGPLKKRALEAEGIEVLACPETPSGLDLHFLLKTLAARGIDSVLSEGGGLLNASLLKEGLADKICLYWAPKILGSGLNAVSGPKTLSMSEALNFRYQKIEQLGEDLYIEAYPYREEPCLQEL